MGKPNSLNQFKTDNNLSLEVYLTDVIRDLSLSVWGTWSILFPLSEVGENYRCRMRLVTCEHTFVPRDSRWNGLSKRNFKKREEDSPGGGGGEYQSKRGLGTPCRGVKQCIKRRREVLIQNGSGVLRRGVGAR